MRRWLTGMAGTAVVATATLFPLLSGTPGARAATLPLIRHVFVIVLENESAASTFESTDAYMGKGGTLQAMGLYAPNYYATGHVSNDNYVSMVSGQAPNPQNQGDCQIYTDFVGSGPALSPGTLPAATPLDGQAVGTGCVYPSSVQTVADQLTKAGHTWKGYMQDMGNDPTRETAVCGHPALNSHDMTQAPEAPNATNGQMGDGYVARHDPFVYFRSITDTSACDNVVPLGNATNGALPTGAPAGTTGLYDDLKGVNGGSLPNLSVIVPNLCEDGHDAPPCTNETAPAPTAVGDMDAFLKAWVPLITGSTAFQKDGLLVVTFDEGAFPSDTSSCCGETPGPNSPLPGILGPGGGRVGAVLISPFVGPGTTSSTAYNHYGLLGSIEDLFSLPRLGFAADVPATFGSDVYTNF